MSSSFVGEHKSDIITTGAGAAAGALLGNSVYKITPSRMVKYAQEGTERKAYVTDTFIKYAEKVSKRDLFSTIDPQTERTWFTQRLNAIKKPAAKARTKPKGGERWQFQKIYDRGIDYMTNRANVPKDDIGLAKRGANAIAYGRKVEKRNTMIACAAILGAACLAVKKGVEFYKEYKAKKDAEE